MMRLLMGCGQLVCLALLALGCNLPVAASSPKQAATAVTHSPARIAHGRRTQGSFSLLAVTRVFQRYGLLKLPSAIAAQATPERAQPVAALGPGTGLWIGVRGGIGQRIHVAARPLAADGKPLGPPVNLNCQVVNPTTVFAEIPAGYNADTRQFQVTVTQRGNATHGASWRLSDLPASVRNGADDLSPIVTAQYGPVTIRAAAVEQTDLSGIPGIGNSHPERHTGDGLAISLPFNTDNHGWTGVPTIRILLSARNASKDSLGQNWLMKINQVTPQWSPATETPSTRVVNPLAVFPVYNLQDLQPGTEWVTCDLQAGVAYPGQQHWVIVEGEMIRNRYRNETVTLHDAEIVHDAAFGGDRVVWRHPETETTPSGISVTALNARAGVDDRPIATLINPNWTFDRGNAEMLLAWHLPPGILPEEYAPLDAEAEADPPRATGLLKSEWNNSSPAWAALAIPGASAAGALLKAHSTPLRLSVQSTIPPNLSRLPRHEGIVIVPPTPLPHHLKDITLRIMLRERQESHPFRLLVPVRASFPPGWDPDAKAIFPSPKI